MKRSSFSTSSEVNSDSSSSGEHPGQLHLLLILIIMTIITGNFLVCLDCRYRYQGFPGGSVIKNLPADAGDSGDVSREDPLEEEMATHSSIVAWRNPWTEEPGGLQSMRWQGVRHYWATKLEHRYRF